MRSQSLSLAVWFVRLLGGVSFVVVVLLFVVLVAVLVVIVLFLLVSVVERGKGYAIGNVTHRHRNSSCGSRGRGRRSGSKGRQRGMGDRVVPRCSARRVQVYGRAPLR